MKYKVYSSGSAKYKVTKIAPNAFKGISKNAAIKVPKVQLKQHQKTGGCQSLFSGAALFFVINCKTAVLPKLLCNEF